LKNFKAFTLIDLSVVIGLILVLSGASLIMFGKVTKNSNDKLRIDTADQIYNKMQDYYKSNFRSYPVPQSADGTQSYHSVEIGKDNDNFLQIGLGDAITKLKKETKPGYGYVYLYSNDATQAAIVVRKLESGESKCNTNSGSIPDIVKDYLTRDSGACYFRAAI
jgi:type II secretory pathway pseudopilin PulG